jgi:hypothetical protein
MSVKIPTPALGYGECQFADTEVMSGTYGDVVVQIISREDTDGKCGLGGGSCEYGDGDVFLEV